MVAKAAASKNRVRVERAGGGVNGTWDTEEIRRL